MKNNILKNSVIIAMLLITVVSCKKDDVEILPEKYNLTEIALYPESFVYSVENELTYIGAYYKGKIVKLDLFGNMSDFVTDQSLVAVVGLAIDKKSNRLWVCNSDAGISQRSGASTTGILAELIAYDLTSGIKLQTIDLSGLYQGGHFLNDLTLDNNGNIYITDSFSPVVYKVDPNGNASVLVTDAMFAAPQGAFGLNGIVYHPDNYLIVGKAFQGLLYKIPLNNPSNVSPIGLSKSVNSLDGLLLLDNNTLALVSNNFTGAPFSEAVYKIESTNGWASASVTNSVTSLSGKYPTSVEMINNGLFVCFGYFPELVDPNSAPNNSFKLQKIKL